MLFNLYFAGSRNKVAEEHILKRKSCRLFSYLNESKDIEFFTSQPVRGKLLIDSGAFSVAHAGAVVNIDDYITYINNHDDIENFIELDKIPYPILNPQTAAECCEVSWKNYLYMIERLNNPDKLLPVFHFGEPITDRKSVV